jgi:hypothetical protein
MLALVPGVLHTIFPLATAALESMLSSISPANSHCSSRRQVCEQFSEEEEAIIPRPLPNGDTNFLQGSPTDKNIPPRATLPWKHLPSAKQSLKGGRNLLKIEAQSLVCLSGRRKEKQERENSHHHQFVNGGEER